MESEKSNLEKIRSSIFCVIFKVHFCSTKVRFKVSLGVSRSSCLSSSNTLHYTVYVEMVLLNEFLMEQLFRGRIEIFVELKLVSWNSNLYY